MRKLRAGQSVDQKGAAKAKDAAAKKGVRSNQSVEQREAAKAKNASAMRGRKTCLKLLKLTTGTSKTQDFSTSGKLKPFQN